LKAFHALGAESKCYLLNLSLCLIFRNNILGVICNFVAISGTKVVLSCKLDRKIWDVFRQIAS
jgi:hypothetical protein